MPASRSLDDRLWQLDTFSSLERTHPSIVAGLKTCLGTYQRLDLASLQALIAARGEDQVAAKAADEAAAWRLVHLHPSNLPRGNSP